MSILDRTSSPGGAPGTRRVVPRAWIPACTEYGVRGADHAWQTPYPPGTEPSWRAVRRCPDQVKYCCRRPRPTTRGAFHRGGRRFRVNSGREMADRIAPPGPTILGPRWRKEVVVVQRLVAVVLVILGLIGVGLGIASATVWRPDGTVVAAASADPRTGILVTDPGVLDMVAEDVTIRATVPTGNRVVIAIGRDTDVDGWVAGAAYKRVTGLASWTRLASRSVPAGGENSATASPPPAATPSGTGTSAGTPAPSGSPAASPSGSATPSGTAADAVGPADLDASDMWVAKATGRGTANLRWSDQAGRWSLIVVGDGAAGSPPALSLTWPRQVTTPWLWPGVVGGSVLAAAGVLLLIVALRGPGAGEPAAPAAARSVRSVGRTGRAGKDAGDKGVPGGGGTASGSTGGSGGSTAGGRPAAGAPGGRTAAGTTAGRTEGKAAGRADVPTAGGATRATSTAGSPVPTPRRGSTEGGAAPTKPTPRRTGPAGAAPAGAASRGTAPAADSPRRTSPAGAAPAGAAPAASRPGGSPSPAGTASAGAPTASAGTPPARPGGFPPPGRPPAGTTPASVARGSAVPGFWRHSAAPGPAPDAGARSRGAGSPAPDSSPPDSTTRRSAPRGGATPAGLARGSAVPAGLAGAPPTAPPGPARPAAATSPGPARPAAAPPGPGRPGQNPRGPAPASSVAAGPGSDDRPTTAFPRTLPTRRELREARAEVERTSPERPRRRGLTGAIPLVRPRTAAQPTVKPAEGRHFSSTARADAWRRAWGFAPGDAAGSAPPADQAAAPTPEPPPARPSDRARPADEGGAR